MTNLVFNTRKIKACISEKGITQSDLAKVLGITPTTISIKLKDGSFKVGEIQKIANYFKKDLNYFFDSKEAENESKN